MYAIALAENEKLMLGRGELFADARSVMRDRNWRETAFILPQKQRGEREEIIRLSRHCFRGRAQRAPHPLIDVCEKKMELENRDFEELNWSRSRAFRYCARAIWRKVRASSVHAETVALSISRPKLVDLLRTSLFVAIAVDTPCSISSLVEEDDLCILLPSATRQRLQRH